jgi:hypothetical protein
MGALCAWLVTVAFDFSDATGVAGSRHFAHCDCTTDGAVLAAHQASSGRLHGRRFLLGVMMPRLLSDSMVMREIAVENRLNSGPLNKGSPWRGSTGRAGRCRQVLA